MAELRDSEVLTRRGAAERLGKMGVRAAPAVPLLIELLGDTESIRFEEFGAQSARTTMLSARTAAIEALALIGEPALPRLIEVLRGHRSPFAREGAATALGRLSDPRVVSPLIRALTDADPSVRAAAAGALGSMSSPQAVEPLRALLATETDPDVRNRAEAAFRKISTGR